ncbi:MAG: phosphatase PAP2 family protein [Prevotella sp.]|nr:phosphatase PAP2 family protein [Prevotella sp.]
MTSILLTDSLLWQLQELDGTLLKIINFAGSESYGLFWHMYSDKVSWTLMAMVAVVCLCHHLCWRQVMLLVGALVLLYVLSDFTVASVLKPLVARIRPSHDEGIMDQLVFFHDYRGGRYGFPSNHASNGFATVTMLGLLYRRRWLTLTAVLWAAGSCYSRMYLGVHYPGDILAGSLIGILIGWLVYGGYRRAYAMAEKRWGPMGDFEQQFDEKESWIIIATFWLTVVALLVIAL